MFGRFSVRDNARVALSAGINSVVTSITVSDAVAPFNMVADPAGDTASGGIGIATLVDSLTIPTKTEIIRYTTLTDNMDGTHTLSGITRGADGTTAQSWLTGAILFQAMTATQLTHQSLVYTESSDEFAFSGDVAIAGSLAVTGAMLAGSLTLVTDLPLTEGGTGASNAANARANLGLVIGTDVQAFDATLSALAAANWVANSIPLGNGPNTLTQLALGANTFPGRSSSGDVVAKAITDFGFSLVDDVDASAGRTTLGLGTSAVKNTGASGNVVPLLDNSSNTWSGAQIIGTASVASSLALNGPAASNRRLDFNTAGASRWIIVADNVAESGSDAGSNFVITAGADGGGTMAVMQLTRSTGLATFQRGFVANESGGDFDFRVEGDTNVNLIFGDASTDRVGIKTATPGYELDVNGTLNATTLRQGGTALGTMATQAASAVAITGGTLNGSLGATTPSTVAATTLTTSSTIVASGTVTGTTFVASGAPALQNSANNSYTGISGSSTYAGSARIEIIGVSHATLANQLHQYAATYEFKNIAASNMLVLSSTGAAVTGILDATGNTVRVRTAKTPASAAAAGNAGDICWDSGFIYVCVATNTWKRAAIATW